jgi:hypothetical protein
MLLRLIKNPDQKKTNVVELPVSNLARKARLALLIYKSVGGMALTVGEINACIRIGMVCMDHDYALLGAHAHAINVARRIVLINAQSEKVAVPPLEPTHDR